MNIISLNTWGGRALHPMLHFLRDNAPTTHIFCLQEVHDTTREYREVRHPDEHVRWDLLELIRTALPHHDGYFARWSDNPNRMSVATFVRHDVPLTEAGTHIVCEPADAHEFGSQVISPRKLQYVRIEGDGCPALSVVNYHGLWHPSGKRDRSERADEMRELGSFVRSLTGPLVMGGDLNLDPDTKAIALLKREGNTRALLDRRTVRTTRTPLYRHWGDANYSQYADYIFVRGVLHPTFVVMPDIVSDHAPLMVQFPWGEKRCASF